MAILALIACLFTLVENSSEAKTTIERAALFQSPSLNKASALLTIAHQMPGRVSTRSGPPSAAAIPRKSSTRTLNSRASTTSRISSPQLEIPDEGPTSRLRTRICSIFADAQRTTAGHRKLVINLRKIQASCCYASAKKKAQTEGDEEEDDFDEGAFNREVARCTTRLMFVKKSEGVGDKVVKFLGLFLKHAGEKGEAHCEVGDVIVR